MRSIVIAMLLMSTQAVRAEEAVFSQVPNSESSVAMSTAIESIVRSPEGASTALMENNTTAPIYGVARCIQHDSEGRFAGWVDKQHCSLSERSNGLAQRIDDWFGDWESDQASLNLRIINELAWIESDGLTPSIRVSGSASLPNAAYRLRLVVSNDDELESNSTLIERLRQSRGSFSLALRWLGMENAALPVVGDIGVRGLGPSDLFIRLRAKKAWGISERQRFLFAPLLRYGSASHARAISAFEWEYAINPHAALNISSVYDYQQLEKEKGIFWEQGLSLAHEISAMRSFAYGFAVKGHMQPVNRTDSNSVWMIWRSQWWRDWLFYEVEPRLEWTRSEHEHREAIAALYFRLEVLTGH